MAGIVAKGDFVRIEFTGKRATDGGVFDTTDAEKAKAAGIHDAKAAYGPKMVVVGKGMVVAGLDQALEGMSVGEEKSVTLEPAQAYGLRKPTLVRVLLASEFRKHDLAPQPGMMLELDGVPAMVRSVTSGRVMVDLNHPLAGEQISFQVKVAEKIEGTENQAKALLQASGVAFDSAKLTGGTLEVTLPKTGKPSAEAFVSRVSFMKAARELMPQITGLDVKESFSLSGPEEKAES